MDGLENLLTLFLIVAPFAALVGWLSWLSRRKACPKCHYAVSPKTGECTHCGYRLPAEGRTDGVKAA